ncbi:hypothetical protein [Pseudomonas sp. MYb118]|uniref:hypothetical protein n=1 Tax=Pseudomonas sp. MYb118 TaxID=1848720 RepID=UPI0034CED301
MSSSLLKVLIISGAVLLSACSGVSTSTCFAQDCQSLDGHSANQLRFGGSAIGSSFSEYSSGLLHDD